jgi:hypothetical protein
MKCSLCWLLWRFASDGVVCGFCVFLVVVEVRFCGWGSGANLCGVWLVSATGEVEGEVGDGVECACLCVGVWLPVGEEVAFRVLLGSCENVRLRRWVPWSGERSETGIECLLAVASKEAVEKGMRPWFPRLLLFRVPVVAQLCFHFLQGILLSSFVG